MLNHKKYSGFSMIEVLVTLGISIVGLVGLASLQLQTSRAIHDTSYRSHAVWLAEDLANRMRANRIGLEFYDTNGVDVSCDNPPQNVCSNYHDGSNVQQSVTCSRAQMAAYDLWELTCGTSPDVDGAITRVSGGSYLPRGSVQVAVNGGNVTITVGWDGRTSGQDSNGNTVYADTGDIRNGRSTLIQAYSL